MTRHQPCPCCGAKSTYSQDYHVASTGSWACGTHFNRAGVLTRTNYCRLREEAKRVLQEEEDDMEVNLNDLDAAVRAEEESP